ncbi:glycosyltransferase involved in cell wall biosynthesis [Elusimicrobium simillimum]|uniref:glycosyltransferase n=1 Tax=Elusimicrobium simillimum TaxID=3143438 RepID=UPI003C6EC023
MKKPQKFKKKKILYIITRLDGGGAQKSVLYSAVNLPRKEYDTFLASGPGGPLEAHAKSKLKNRFFTIKSLRQRVSVANIPADILSVFQTYLIIRKIHPDIIHTNCPKAGIVGRAASILYPRAKVVHTYHGLGFSMYGGIKRFFIFTYIEKFWAALADKLIFVSQANMNEAANLGIGGNKKNILLHAGAEFEELKPSFDRQKKLASLGIKEDSKVVLGIGNFKPLKNAKEFVLTAAQVIKRMPNVHFLYVGFGGTDEAKTKTLAKKLGLKKHFSFLGLRHDVRELFAISDIYVSTSLREGLPIALLEALAYGVPALCYEADGTSEVLINNQNGYIFGQGRKDELASKIVKVLGSESLLNHLKNGAKSFNHQKYSAQTTVLKQTELYKKLLKK